MAGSETRCSGIFSFAQIIARPTPKVPEVVSTTVVAGVILPARKASVMISRAGRSFISRKLTAVRLPRILTISGSSKADATVRALLSKAKLPSLSHAAIS